MTEDYKKILTGRPPKLNPCTHCVMVRFNDDEYARFMSRYEESGVYAKAVFCKAMVFGEPFRVIREDEEMRSCFSERGTQAILRNLENTTNELSCIAPKVIRLAHEVKKKEIELEKYKND